MDELQLTSHDCGVQTTELSATRCPAAAGRTGHRPAREPSAGRDQVASPPDPDTAEDQTAEAWGHHMAGLLREWMHARATAEAAATEDRDTPRPLPESADQRLARVLAEALRAQADSRHDAPYVGPDLPDDILLQGWFDLEQAAKVLGVVWPRPLSWRRRQRLSPLLVEALQRQLDDSDRGRFISPTWPDVLLDGWWNLEAAMSHILAALTPATGRRAGLRFLTGSPTRPADG
ncbi:hypothetical protein [Nocardia sp. alder85J]|uniref:hypothetical protein n=1 Tax=Nocardia sp. alder85J TaxID=2862949 RepID=UPI001CD79E86|nr:hypothetical protein [Nocardia sp. alder85J]MCX4098347.1 hypothetical protein [Nocardia sp. alder85J]